MATKIWVGTTTAGDLNVAGNWSPSGVPTAGDDVYFPIGSAAISASLDALKTATIGGALGIVEFQEGYSGTIGTKDAYMTFTATTFRWGGTGTAYLDLQASAISFELRRSARPAGPGQAGLYLKGSALATITVAGDASVAIAAYGGETSTVTTARLVGPSASMLLGTGVTVTTVQVVAGTATIRCGGTTLDIQGGTVTTSGSGTWTTATLDGGTAYLHATGTITTCNLNAGTLDMLGGAQARTISTLNHNGGVLRYDENVVTLTTYNRKDGPSQITVTDP